MSAKQIFAKCRSSVVKIVTNVRVDGKWMVGTGTGFFFQSDDLVVTAYHVVQGAKSIDVTDISGKHYTAKYIGINPQSDVALLRLSKHTHCPPLRPKAFVGVSVGDPVFSIGNSLGVLGYSLSQGIVSARRKPGGHPLVQSTASISKGNSGGPLIDEKGNVIGVVSFYLRDGQNLNMAIAVDEVQRTLKDKEAWFDSSVYLANYAYTASKPTREQRRPSTPQTNVEADTRTGTLRTWVAPESKFAPNLVMEGPQSEDNFEQVGISPEGRYVVGSAKNCVYVLNIASRTSNLARLDSDIKQVAFFGEDFLVVCRTDGVVEYRGCPSLALLRSIDAKEVYDSMRVSPTGATRYVAKPAHEEGVVLRTDWYLSSVDPLTGSTKILRKAFADQGQFDLSSDGEKIVGVEDGLSKTDHESGPDVRAGLLLLSLADGATIKLKDEITFGRFNDLDGNSRSFTAWMSSPVFSPDGSTVAVITHKAGDVPRECNVETFNVASGLPKRRYPLEDTYVESIGFTDDGQHLVFTNNSTENPWRAIRGLDLKTGRYAFKMAAQFTNFDKVVCASKAPVLAVSEGNRLKVFRLR